ncbi:hypothetical protein [Roseomonas indoligenes]|uniref:Galectin n=1 Tax=Roseomonas indoligenes TaxID=2820811 RepID=A0A940N414_9PROT|nr:hypothetical protein [Pararoseomonas indoligenes]MBP0496194.1 hypothetical protein [Pararoseomonas indoligenes]
MERMAPGQPTSIAGRHELLIAAAAAARGESLDVMLGEDILLHLKPFPENLLVNSRFGGRWGSERRIALPAGAGRADLALSVELAEGRASFLSGEALLLEVPLAQPLAGARLLVSDNILKVGGDGAPGGVLHGQIGLADAQHVSGLVQLAPGEEAAAIEFRADGRPLSRLEIAPGGTSGGARRFGIPHPWEALVYEGMWVEMRHGGAVLDAVPLRSRYFGAVEHCSDRSVSGWARNPAMPAAPLVVDIYVNGRFRGSARANGARPGMPQDGAGFHFRFPEPILLPESQEARVSVRVGDTDLELTNSPWWICRPVTYTGPLPAGA